MGHKTFISYKYSESQNLRDKILAKMGSDAIFYKGETSDSPDLTDYKTSTIREHLSDMIYDTSVMIVIVSQNMLQSEWMEWEIKYALREQSRNGRTSHADGVVCVVKKDNYNYFSPYNWAKRYDGGWDKYKLFDVINNNRENKKSSYYFDGLSSNYIDIVTEDEFLRNPKKYIDEAYEKSQNLDKYNNNLERRTSLW